MSRSKRKPYASCTGLLSNKKDKQAANRKFRHRNKQNLLTGKELMYRLKECYDIWGFKSDGLDHYIPGDEWFYRPEEKEEYLKKIQRK